MGKQNWVCSFKKFLPFWPEAVFSLALLILFIGNLVELILGKIELDLGLLAFTLLFFGFAFCLIGQFFWKNSILSLFLSIPLGLGSVYMSLAVLSEMSESTQTNSFMGLIFGMILFGILTIAAIIMPWKYFSCKPEN